MCMYPSWCAHSDGEEVYTLAVYFSGAIIWIQNKQWLRFCGKSYVVTCSTLPPLVIVLSDWRTMEIARSTPSFFHSHPSLRQTRIQRMKFPRTSPLPKPYYYALAVGEPLGMLGVGAYAIFFPNRFFEWFLRPEDAGVLAGSLVSGGGGGPRGILVAGGMGSCMTILGLLSYLTLPILQKVLQKDPEAHETILTRYFAAFSFGDVLHIAVILALMPADVRKAPFEKWTIMLWGNVLGTALPAFVRLAWFAGIGRPTFGSFGTTKSLKGKARDVDYQSTGSSSTLTQDSASR